MGWVQTLRRRLETQAAAWVRRRQGEDHLPLPLSQRRLYILPTRAGLAFAALVFLMLLAGLNYANGLGLFLTFALAGLALAAMHQCHRNLLGMQVAAALPGTAFAGETAPLELAVANPSALGRVAVEASVLGARSGIVDLPPAGGARLRIDLPTTRRGRLRIDRVRVSTCYPFGLFEAWTWLHLPLEALVYPAAVGAALPIDVPGLRAGDSRPRGPGDDEWSGLRPYRQGDSPRQVDWRAYARGAPLLVKEFMGARAAERIFDYDGLSGLGEEARLEQLCRWIVDADARGERYGLRLPGTELPTGEGRVHRDRALRALALFGEPAGDSAREPIR